MEQPNAVLKQYWGFDVFRPLQKDIIVSVLNHKDTLALLPTGGGKSICFQVPAMCREGICIVVSPLIALMKDQVGQLKNRGIAAAMIYSGQTRREIDITLDNCVYGQIKFLYVSPERLQTEIFKERVKKMQVNLLAVDEAHCISQWGYDFRPPYLQIASLRELIPDVNIIALTATATHAVKVDIQEKLLFKNAAVFQKSFARENLSYSVLFEDDKERKLLDILQGVPGSAIVYVSSRKRTKQVADLLNRNQVYAGYYHAGLTHVERTAAQEQWLLNKMRVIVATNAFGMGIDKPDVRLVVHLDPPESIEAYYQEAGRAGRDEKKAYAVLLIHEADLENLKERVMQAYPEPEFLKKVYQCLANYYKIAVGSSLLASYDMDIDAFRGMYNLPHLNTYHAMKKLQEEGFIELNEVFFVPSRILILLDNKKLYEFQITNEKYDLLLKTLLRMYGGELFSEFGKINERKMATALHVPVAEVEKDLLALHQLEVLSYDKQKDQPQLTFLTPRYDANKLPLQHKKLQERKNISLEKVDAVAGYARHKQRCRTLLLLDYFGEVSYDNCNICDVCIARKKSPPSDHAFYAKKIKDSLQLKPLDVEKLVEIISPENQQELLGSIRIMLDSGELRQDEFGRLRIGE